MYYVTPFPHVLYALDPLTGNKKWEYFPKPLTAAKGVACCDEVNRGAAFDGGKVYYVTLDSQVVAVHANNGKEFWKVRIGNINMGESMTMAPIVVKGKVIVGNAGGEFGVRGWIQALDANSGKTVWKAFNTGPDGDVLIGASFKPPYKEDQGTDLGVTTWPPDHWKIGGGNVWGWVSYDPELDLIYYGARPTPARGIPRFGPVTTSGPRPSSLAGPTQERRSGRTSSHRTTCTTTTASLNPCSWTSQSKV